MAEPHVTHRDDGSVTILTLTDTTKRNALSRLLQSRLLTALEEAVGRRADAIVIEGAGGTFAAGADLAELAGRTEWETYAAQAQQTFAAVEKNSTPVIAA